MAKEKDSKITDKLESWDNIVGNFLKPEHLEGAKGSFLVEDVKVVEKVDGKVTLTLMTRLKNVLYEFMLNWTNLTTVKDKTNAPLDIRGKTVKWEKVRVQNPKTKAMMDSISIVDVE